MSGKQAVKVLPWVHTLIANIKDNIRGVYPGVSAKHLPRYLAKFCYCFNRRFCEHQRALLLLGSGLAGLGLLGYRRKRG